MENKNSVDRPVWNRGLKMSEGFRKKVSESMSGEKHWNWKGGHRRDYKYRAVARLKNQEFIANRKKPINCELCNRFGRIIFEHNHKNGKFRGWLCQRCNLVLSMVDERIEILNKLIVYLIKDGV